MGLADGVAWERDYGAPERRTVARQQPEADWIKECTEKISNAIGGGSELFVRHGEGFRLDVDFVCKRIVEMRERHHEVKRSCVLAAREAEALKREIAEKDAEILKLRRLATDRAYMMKAYRDMLGPNGLEVAEMWERKGVLRQHTDWGPASVTMTGEERAQVLLGVEEDVSQPIDFLDSNIDTSDFRARALLSKESGDDQE